MAKQIHTVEDLTEGIFHLVKKQSAVSTLGAVLVHEDLADVMVELKGWPSHALRRLLDREVGARTGGDNVVQRPRHRWLVDLAAQQLALEDLRLRTSPAAAKPIRTMLKSGDVSDSAVRAAAVTTLLNAARPSKHALTRTDLLPWRRLVTTTWTGWPDSEQAREVATQRERYEQMWSDLIDRRGAGLINGFSLRELLEALGALEDSFLLRIQTNPLKRELIAERFGDAALALILGVTG